MTIKVYVDIFAALVKERIKRWLLTAAINTAILAALIVIWWHATTRFVVYFVQYIDPILKPYIIWATNNGELLNTAIIVAVLIQLYLIFLIGLYKFYRWWNRVA